jgi:hypothetical protein
MGANPLEALGAGGLNEDNQLVAAGMKDRAHLTLDVAVIDGVPEVHRPTTDRALAGLSGEKGAPLLQRGAVIPGARSDGRPVFLAKDTPIARGGGTALALATAAPAQPVVRLVYGHPLAVLLRFSLATGKRWKARGVRSHSIALAVLGDSGFLFFGREAGTALGRHPEQW